MIVTLEWLKSHATKKGGWTRQQLDLLQIQWPPRKGWLKATVGLNISDDAARRFEVLGRQPVSPLLWDEPPTAMPEPTKADEVKSLVVSGSFHKFWTKYPRKEAKLDAMKAWAKR